ncbi:hypothetical protein [Spiroplasma endosymbiont of Polydrusus cervinus]|uniref:hypothetical protein n=1 Tax=Spiroplasma endosymbiont of Polydrusus cervinus TaxID=3066287 RepID=UPI0030D0EFE9
MEKTYLIKILAKKDATLNYKAAMSLTQKLLTEENGVVDPKIILRFKWYCPTQEIFESIYSTAERYGAQKLLLTVIRRWFQILH